MTLTNDDPDPLYEKTMPDHKTVAEFKARCKSVYPNYELVISYADGTPAPDHATLGEVRQSYRKAAVKKEQQ